MGRTLKFGVTALAVGLAAWGAYWFATQNGDSGPAVGVPATTAVVVEASPVRLGPLVRKVDTIGTLRSEESVVLRPELSGRIVKIGFREGQPVEKGQILVALDDSIAKAEVAEAEASLALSKANYERAKELTSRGAASQRARDEAVAAMHRDEASVALARARLAKTKIAAPYAGVVGLRQVGVGDYVSPGQELVTLDVIDPIKIDFRIPELYLSAVREGQTVEFELDALAERAFTGAVYAIDPKVDINGRSLVIRARGPNTGNLLRPGLFARVELILDRRDAVLFIPEEALIPQGTDHFVFKVVDGTAHWTQIDIGPHSEQDVEVISGLRPADLVVTAGQMKLRDGVAVAVRPGTGE